VLDQNGGSQDSTVIKAIEEAIRVKQTYNVRVINLSVGRPIYESCALDPLCQAAEAAWRNGIVVVAAAGNQGRNGYATILSPGNSPSAITVGCMKTLATYSPADDLIASYSSKGPTYIDQTVKPDLVAPGNLVVSLLAPGSMLAKAYPGNVVGTSYYTTSSTAAPAYLRLSGTSMATPVVTGMVALMLQGSPGLSPDTVKARLMKSANKTFPLTSTATDPSTGTSYTSTYDMFTIGAGYVDMGRALLSTETAIGSARSPSAVYNPFTSQVSLLVEAQQIWSGAQAGSWGTNVVWGTNVLSGTNVVWGTNVAWGTNTVSGTNVVWGTNTMSGTNVVWGTTQGNGE